MCKYYFETFEDTEENFTAVMENNKCNDEETSTLINQNIDDNQESNSLWFNYAIIMTFALFNSFLSQGIRYILPKTLTHFYHLKTFNLNEDNVKHGYNHNATLVSIELQLASTATAIISFLTGILIESSFLKRLRLLRIGIVLSALFSFLAFYIRKKIDIFACILKSVFTLQDQIMDIYSSETFDTKRRLMLLSAYNIIQSTSSFTSPYVNDLITNYWFRLNYLIFFIALCFLFILSLLFSKEKIIKIIN